MPGRGGSTKLASEAHAAHGHGILHHHFDDLEQQRECTSLGMWLFLSTEIMMFGGLFFAYSLYRWAFPGGFLAGSEHLLLPWGTANTFVLLFSSLTMAMAVHAAVEGKQQWVAIWLGATWILGAAFLGIKAIEWGTDYREGLIPAVNWTYYTNPEHADKLADLATKGTNVGQVAMYFVLYFCMTGLHALHMIIGLGLV